MKSAEKIVNAIKLLIGAEFQTTEIEKYNKGGHVCTLSAHFQAGQWPETVFGVISMGQNVARGWQITGDIHEEIDLFSSETSISGLQAVNIICFNDEAT